MTDLRAQLQAGLGGTYTLERELGRGGMATVFLARDLKHDRPVALKVLHPELAASLGPERFLREIKLAARLQHPHILTVLDSGDVAGRLWFTMPFVEGESLRDRLRRERQLPVEDALRIAREAAQALQYAHGHGVIHRDIKPENLLLTDDGNTLVADFGIARTLGTGGQEKLTETGLVVGTPAYMSPEQAAGDKGLDARTDVYSLAAVLYEMLGGEPPFTGATTQAMLVRRLTEPAPSVRAVRPNVPESADLAIRKALSPVAADRFGTMAQFGQALAGGERTVVLPAPASAGPDAAPASTTPRGGPQRRFPLATAALLLGLLIGGGALFAWRRSHDNGETSDGRERRIAVLPFQNLGDSADAYFADGITDAVRGKLTALPSMRVIGSNSSAQYRGTSKTPQEIGRELGVDYLLVGKVRWQKGASGAASRVQVSPELIDVATADARWQQPFDASLTDVFQVQADIAGRVAQALDVAIGSPQQKALENRPTRNLAAYDAYLKGQAQRALGNDAANLRLAGGYFERAVALDSGFVAAWAALATANALLYSNGTPSPAIADRARTAAERALALDPENPASYRALGEYHRLVTINPEQAVAQYSKGLALAPNDAELQRVLGISEQALGRSDSAVQHLRRARALDPRSGSVADALGNLLLSLRQYDEALEATNAAVAIQPSNLSYVETKLMVLLARGDTAGARAVVRQPPGDVDMPTFVAYVATYYDLYWTLDAGQRALVKRLTPTSFDGDAGSWGLALAGVYEVEGDRRRATAYGDSARVAFEQQLYAAPDNSQLHALYGVALAYAGRKDAAIREGQRALPPDSTLSQQGNYNRHQLARIYILTGEQEKALDVLESLLARAYHLSPGWLRIDPTFEPLRNNPRFRRLVSGGSPPA
jgi:eukaryotic-like serine/threonine-protein kinase